MENAGGLPFTGFSTIPLAIAGLVAVAFGAISQWLGKSAKH
jgi:hypothetical protein